MSAGLHKSDEMMKNVEKSSAVGSTESTRLALGQALNHVLKIVPPVWPLADYVAVNPCLGLTDRHFLGAHQLLSSVRSSDLLMPLEYFRELAADGQLPKEELEAAYLQCRTECPDWCKDFEFTELTERLGDTTPASTEETIRFRTVAEAVDQRQESTWSSHIVNDITRHCAAHFDEGQAVWKSPWQETSLYAAWKEACRFSRRMDLLGLPHFQAFVSTLPADPRQAIEKMLFALDVPPTHWGQFLLCQAFSVAGWASYIRYRVREAEFASQTDDDLIGLLAMRLAYDTALARSPGIPWPLPLWPADTDLENGAAVPPRPGADVISRYAFQLAAERAYRRNLLATLKTGSDAQADTARKVLQMVFCIDVRSEVFRRNLESIDESIETFGFAGFFGLPLEYVPLGFENGTANCPVLLKPGFQVHERLRGCCDSEQKLAEDKVISGRKSRKGWKLFQSSATSCFSFVEALGLTYLGKLLSDTLHWTKPGASDATDGLTASQSAQLGPDIHASVNRGLDETRRVDLAEGMLRNLGLTEGFARVVAICGHASEVTNNPYRAALDCGACGGHSGEPNARVAAALLNDSDVRIGLAARGIHIPHDTWFLAAVHNTTSDNIILCDAHLIPSTHLLDLTQIEQWFENAGQLSRIERSSRLGTVDSEDAVRRSQDWSEVRPEWGLAGNAAFIVAPRSRTVGLDLGGRTFLHSYDYQKDPERKVLELIMTAPMVVTNWINMQYYASTVDPVAFGSGNKVIHNVVGQFGVLEGNGGDLMTGLPWQCVHDGERLQHEPLRLVVVIDAPRSAIEQILNKHSHVRDLVSNGWVSLVAWETDEFYRWTAAGTWEQESVSIREGGKIVPQA